LQCSAASDEKNNDENRMQATWHQSLASGDEHLTQASDAFLTQKRVFSKHFLSLSLIIVS